LCLSLQRGRAEGFQLFAILKSEDFSLKTRRLKANEKSISRPC